jgi:hypothetical protein
MIRVDVESGETRVSAYRGGAVLDDGGGGGRVRLSAGERTAARWGGAAAEPEPFDIAPEDDFARWDEARESEERWASRSSEYLPAELDPYAAELERNGSWRYEASVGYVWAPRVAAGWSPYANGYWSWTPYGWTWVPYEPWGWAPFHYGRWGFSIWYWAPGRAWGPGWVSWGVGTGYVGWCPLGYRDRPVYAWGGHHRGHAVPRHGGHGWNVVRDGDFGHRDVARRRVPLAGIDPGALRVAESPNLRPTRNARSLVASSSTARAISRRPTPGDFVRELAVDNKTTIPSPWLRRGRAPSAETRAREAQDQASAARPRRGTLDSGSAARASCRSRSSARRRPARWRAVGRAAPGGGHARPGLGCGGFGPTRAGGRAAGGPREPPAQIAVFALVRAAQRGRDAAQRVDRAGSARATAARHAGLQEGRDVAFVRPARRRRHVSAAGRSACRERARGLGRRAQPAQRPPAAGGGPGREPGRAGPVPLIFAPAGRQLFLPAAAAPLGVEPAHLTQ